MAINNLLKRLPGQPEIPFIPFIDSKLTNSLEFVCSILWDTNNERFFLSRIYLG